MAAILSFQWPSAEHESKGKLRKERIKTQIYKNRALALADVADYIDTFYNRIRRHSYLAPVPVQYQAAKSSKHVKS